MREQTYIRLHDTSATEASWCVKTPGQALVRQLQRGALADIPAALLQLPVTVFVPAEAVLLTGAKVPTRNRSRLLKAVPYALEDQLIDDVDELHFAVATQADGDTVSTAVVARAMMDTWLARCRECGITVDKLYPAQLALPLESSRWTVLINDNNTACVRTDANTGFACDTPNLLTLLERKLKQSQQRPESVDVINCAALALDKNKLESDLGVTIHSLECQGDALIACIRADAPAINLLQGSYSPANDWQAKTRRWWPAAAVFALWLVMGGATQTYDYYQLNRQAQANQAEIDAVYKSVFPNSKNNTDPYKQLKQRLDQLSDAGGEVNDFIGLLGQSGDFLRQAQGMEITTLSYREGQIDIDVSFTDTSALTALRQRFSSLKGLQVDVQSTSIAGNKVRSRLRIKGLSS